MFYDWELEDAYDFDREYQALLDGEYDEPIVCTCEEPDIASQWLWGKEAPGECRKCRRPVL